MISEEKIIAYLRDELSSNRFHHSMEVANLSLQLARCHGVSLTKAYRAGLLHDIVKEWSPKKLYRYAQKHDLRIPNIDFMRENGPNLMHAYVGADVAKKKGWVTASAFVRAIRFHTLGEVAMGIPEKIVFIADFASKDRKFREARRVRELAMVDLDQGFLMALGLKMQFNLLHHKPIHPKAVQVWNHFHRARKK